MTDPGSDILDPYALPALDCHAHIAPDVTRPQLKTLGRSHVFAMTRSVYEASSVVTRTDPGLTWGLGVHPGLAAARSAYDPDEFRHLLTSFALVGEVGLDKRASQDDQSRILEDVMRACDDEPVFVSIHSTGMTSAIAELIHQHRHPGTILHWWLGSPADTERAITAGAYFSVNAAMDDQRLAALPRNRVLPETDFPARSTRGRRPGDIEPLETRLAEIWKMTVHEVRQQWWTNLRQAAVRSGALDRVGDSLADLLLTV